MRFPKPAANTIAVLGIGALNVERSWPSGIVCFRWLPQRPRQVALIPEDKRPEQRMLEVLGEMALDPRQVGQILRLAVPLVEPRENAQNFGRALRAHCG